MYKNDKTVIKTNNKIFLCRKVYFQIHFAWHNRIINIIIYSLQL